MPIVVYGTTSPYSSSYCRPYIEYTVTKQTGSFKINWEVGMYCGSINWGASPDHIISCDGQSTSETIGYYKSTSSLSQVVGATGSFTISNPSGESKTVTLTYKKSGLSVSYNGNKITSLSVSAEITSNNTASSTKCSAPTSVTVASTSADPGAKVTLTWSGAKAGTANSITGYDIQKREYNGESWTSWTSASPASVSSTSTSCSASVTISSTPGNQTQFRVRTKGSAGSSYYSAWSSASGNVKSNVDACVPPEIILDRGWYLNSQYNQIKLTLVDGGGTAGNDMTGYSLQCRIDGGAYSSSSISPTSISTTSPSAITKNVTISGVSSGYHTFTIACRTTGEVSSAWVYSNDIEVFPDTSAPSAPIPSVVENSYFYIEGTLSSSISQNPIIGVKLYYRYTLNGTNYQFSRDAEISEGGNSWSYSMYDFLPNVLYTFGVSAIYEKTGETSISWRDTTSTISYTGIDKIKFTKNN